MFAEAFTDRYSRDGLVGVRVPQLNSLVWRYALEDAGDGSMVWRDAEGHMVAFNMVHRSGTEGWMGPLAVRPDRQGEGLGSVMVRTGIDWLRAQGATTIGLETMPRTVDNIGFYSRIGLVPGHLTVTLVHDVPRRASRGRRSCCPALDRRGPSGWRNAGGWPTGCLPGVDFTRELALTRELGIGDTTLVRDGGVLTGFALWHSTPLAAGRPKDELRVLKLVAARPRCLRAPASGAFSSRRPASGSAAWPSAARLNSPRPTCAWLSWDTGFTGPICGCFCTAIPSGFRPRASLCQTGRSDRVSQRGRDSWFFTAASKSEFRIGLARKAR